jgi:hypothetical protein
MLLYKQIAFAGPLKEGLAVMGFPEPKDRELKELLIPGFGFSWRKAAQTLGTEWGRSLQGDIWLAITKERCRTMPYDRIVITDVRFHNEADWVRENGLLVHVVGRQATMVGDEAKHASEHGIRYAPGDYTIHNTGTPAELMARVQELQVFLQDAAK